MSRRACGSQAGWLEPINWGGEILQELLIAEKPRSSELRLREDAPWQAAPCAAADPACGAVQSPNHVWLQLHGLQHARLPCPFTNSRSWLTLMSIETVVPSNHLILCGPLLLLPSIFTSIRVFSMSRFFTSGGQSIGASASASVLPMNIQDWFPFGLTGLISLQSQGLSRVFSNAVYHNLCLITSVINISSLLNTFPILNSIRALLTELLQ